MVKISEKKNDPSISAFAVAPVLGVLLSVVIYHAGAAALAPATSVGEAGLQQMHLYLSWVFFGSILKALSIGLSVWIGYALSRILALGQQKRQEQQWEALREMSLRNGDPRMQAIVEKYRQRDAARPTDEQPSTPRSVVLILSAALGAVVLLFTAKPAGWEEQCGKNGYTGPMLWQTGRLLLDIEADMAEGGTVEMQSDGCSLSEKDHSYRSQSRSGSHTVHMQEYVLCDASGRTLAQITRGDRDTLRETTLCYAPHRLTFYAHSGLLCSYTAAGPDGEEAPQEEPAWESLYTLSFDPEESAYHVDPVPPDSQDLLLTVFLDEEVLEEALPWPKGGDTLDFHIGWDGTYAALLQLRTHNGTRVVSNTEIFDTNAYAQEHGTAPPPTDPPSPEVEGTLTDTGDGYTQLAFGNYPICLRIPSGVGMEILQQDTQADISGEYRTLAEGGDDRMYIRIEWMHEPYRASTEWCAEEMAQHMQETYPGSRAVPGELTAQDGTTGYWYRIERGTSDLEYPHFICIYEIGDHTYAHIRIACADVNAYKEAMQVLESFSMAG